jgi:hypothetical protein
VRGLPAPEGANSYPRLSIAFRYSL